MLGLVGIAVSLMLAVFLLLAAYLLYLYMQYHRLPDDLEQESVNPKRARVQLDKAYKIMTFNIGYGSYPADFSFFLEGGRSVRADSMESVQTALAETLAVIQDAAPDFIHLQEVDKWGARSRWVDELAYFRTGLSGYASVWTQNYDSAYLLYPPLRPIGAAVSGLLSFFRYEVAESWRHQLPIEQNFRKFFDLDRVFSLSFLPISGSDRRLVLCNTHLSAYIRDREIQRQQLSRLFERLQKQAQAGDYVICGADFNRDLTGQTVSDLSWLQPFPMEELPEGLRLVLPENAPTVRSLDVPYGAESTLAVVDGFLLSENVRAISVEARSNDFRGSDHQGVLLTFELEG